MSWVEELKPDDEVKVEIRFPLAYVEHDTATMKKFSSAAALTCKAAAILEEDDTEFLFSNISVMQAYALKEVLGRYNIELEFDLFRANGITFGYFYADVRGLQELLKQEEEDGQSGIM